MTKLPVVAHTFLYRYGSVLLVRRSNTGFEDGNYGPDGGHPEGHESIRQAAVRECREETGAEVDSADLEIVGVTHYDSPTGEGIDFSLGTARWRGDPYPKSECDEVVWCAFDEVLQKTTQARSSRLNTPAESAAGEYRTYTGWSND